MRNTWILIGGLFVLVVIFLCIILFPSKKTNQTPSFAPTPTPVLAPFNQFLQGSQPSPTQTAIPTGTTVTISGVPVQNFYQTTTPLDPEGDRTIATVTNGYKIEYLQQFGQFLITITGTSFDQDRQQAEEALLKQLNISQQEACGLNIVITTPANINPNQAGQEYPLSFCQGTTPATQNSQTATQVAIPTPVYQTTARFTTQVGGAAADGTVIGLVNAIRSACPGGYVTYNCFNRIPNINATTKKIVNQDVAAGVPLQCGVFAEAILAYLNRPLLWPPAPMAISWYYYYRANTNQPWYIAGGPQVGEIVLFWSDTFGHIGFVTQVYNSRNFQVAEANFSSGVVDLRNYTTDGTPLSVAAFLRFR